MSANSTTTLTFKQALIQPKVIPLYAVILVELLVIFVLAWVHRLDRFHKITLSRVEKEIQKQETEHAKQLA
jgi:biopolymer transport protein ExbD